MVPMTLQERRRSSRGAADDETADLTGDEPYESAEAARN
jgi:hypothetical protein